MDFEWVAIALGDVTWISVAFLFGFLARLINLPPLVGFLATGFLLNYLGMASGEMLQKLADLGIILLLFTVGLKLNLKVLIKPQVWSVTLIHITIIIGLFSLAIYTLSLLHAPLFETLDFKNSALIAFALSFSSTVFVVKVLEEKGEMSSFHGRIAIGILIMQDLLAVIFLAASAGKLPSYWALLLFLLIPARPVFHYILEKTGHGELLILYALVLALGGAEMFELTGVKGYLGALFMGILISSHSKSTEMAKSMLGFKDLFLVGFFLSIGMAGQLSLEALTIGLLIVPFMFIKSALFYALMIRFKLRARTAFLASINLTNYSEFGLIVAAIGVTNGWIDSEWLVIIAIALSFSFLFSAPLNRQDDKLYSKNKYFLRKHQSTQRLIDDPLLDTRNAKIAIFGMGRVGRGAYDKMVELYGDSVVGFDFDANKVERYKLEGYFVLQGDPSDADFWDKIKKDNKIQLVMLALTRLQENLEVLDRLREISFTGQITVTAKYPDEIILLTDAGATAVYNVYTEAGAGFANHVGSLISR
ncbi:MAG: glutathione-regulated potassium-efflux system ancillary protein KefC [Polaribacter sp.]|jgi:glutathione-regulated potassium-efflux system ancillary protein KefC